MKGVYVYIVLITFFSLVVSCANKSTSTNSATPAQLVSDTMVGTFVGDIQYSGIKGNLTLKVVNNEDCKFMFSTYPLTEAAKTGLCTFNGDNKTLSLVSTETKAVQNFSFEFSTDKLQLGQEGQMFTLTKK